jgi:PAS domain S-box-containing protein
MDDKRLTEPSTWSEALNESTIELRKRWLNFSPADEELVQEVDVLIRENVDLLIDAMYSHFLSFQQTRVFFPDDATLRRAQQAQKAYFVRLCKGNYDRDYVAQRLAVGDTHYRIGLDPTWYLGAYNQVMDWCRKLVQQKYTDDFEKYMQVIAALTRLVFFDMGLAIEAYSIAKESAIRRQRDAIAELETQRRVTNSILQDAPVGIIQLDDKLHFIAANLEFLAMTGLKEDSEVIGQPVESVIPYLDRQVLQAVLAGEPYKRIAEYLNLSQKQNPSPAYYDWTAWPMRAADGDITGLVATFSDATDRVLLHQQREDFVATLTHDLKTPILAANRAIKLLMDGDFGPVVQDQQRILETIHQSNESMYKMVQTLLDVYRYDSGLKNLSLSETDACEMVRSFVDEFRPLAESRGINLSYEAPRDCINVMCDATEIRRVIQNFVDNAMKFTAAGGAIKVQIDQDKFATTIAVKDTGKGIAEEDKPKLFQRFWAAASSGRYYASTGLGLYLCRKIVELHGGTIWVESQLGKGSTFAFRLKSDDQI